MSAHIEEWLTRMRESRSPGPAVRITAEERGHDLGWAFAVGETGPECIVSGGKGTMAVTYQGKTYYVCCSGCRSEFNENPAKYVAEYETKKKKK